MLCHVCSNIDIDQLRTDIRTHPAQNHRLSGLGYKHHLNFRRLLQAAEKKCELCQLLNASADHRNLSSALDKQLYLYTRNENATKREDFGSYELFLYCPSGRQGQMALIIAQLEVYIERDSPLSKSGINLISGRPVSRDPASDECIFLIKSFLNQCLKRHETCRSSYAPLRGLLGTFEPPKSSVSPSRMWPTRTIDVGFSNGFDEPRLVIHTAEERLDDWITLTHCWGGSCPLRTTSDTLDERMQSISMTSLPPLFQDAVTITRKLGVRHLWIDSLCIIQDSRKDWERESAQMGNIYQNSILTLAAHSAPNCFGRLLGERTHVPSAVRIPFTSQKLSVSGDLLVRPQLPNRWAVLDVLEKGKHSSINTRAWVLQESILSPRTLHFSSQQVIFQCRTNISLEGNVTQIDCSEEQKRHPNMNWMTNKRFLQPLQTEDVMSNSTSRDGSADSKSRRTLYNNWYTVVNNYTTRDLTVPGDKLPAIGGLASAFQAQLKDSYLAGLFEDDLLRGLAWKTDNPLITSRSISYRAPSWSWASVEGTVKTQYSVVPLEEVHAEAQVLHHEMIYGSALERDSLFKESNRLQHSGHNNVAISPMQDVAVKRDKWLINSSSKPNINPFGPVSSGKLVIKGRWKTADSWDLGHISTHFLQLKSYDSSHKDNVLCNFDVTRSPDERASVRESFGFLHLWTLDQKLEGKKRRLMIALILEETGHGEREYRRIGFATLGGLDSDDWEVEVFNIV